MKICEVCGNNLVKLYWRKRIENKRNWLPVKNHVGDELLFCGACSKIRSGKKWENIEKLFVRIVDLQQI